MALVPRGLEESTNAVSGQVRGECRYVAAGAWDLNIEGRTEGVALGATGGIVVPDWERRRKATPHHVGLVIHQSSRIARCDEIRRTRIMSLVVQ